MNKAEPFFSLAELRQPVNQWLCIIFLGLLCFWTLVYYFTNKAEAVSDRYVNERAAALNAK
jgi:hypothetical protein